MNGGSEAGGSQESWPSPGFPASSTLPLRPSQSLTPEGGARHRQEQEGQPGRTLMSQLKRGLGMATWQSLGTGFLTPAKGNRLVAKRRSPAEWCAIWGFLCVKCLHGPPGSLPTVTRLVSRQRVAIPFMLSTSFWPLPGTRLPPPPQNLPLPPTAPSHGDSGSCGACPKGRGGFVPSKGVDNTIPHKTASVA